LLGGVSWLFVFDGCFYGSKYYGNFLENVDLRVPNRNFRDISLFTFDFKRRICPSAECATAANGIGSDTDIFNGRSALVNDWLVSGTFVT
jgi:hypothetical protein